MEKGALRPPGAGRRCGSSGSQKDPPVWFWWVREKAQSSSEAQGCFSAQCQVTRIRDTSSGMERRQANIYQMLRPGGFLLLESGFTEGRLSFACADPMFPKVGGRQSHLQRPYVSTMASDPPATWKRQSVSAKTEFNVPPRDTGREQSPPPPAPHSYFLQQRAHVGEKAEGFSIPTSPPPPPPPIPGPLPPQIHKETRSTRCFVLCFSHPLLWVNSFSGAQLG